MSKNFSMLQRPPKWVSAHRECRFKYKLRTGTLAAVGSSGGKLVVGLSNMPYTAQEGERIYVYTSTTHSNLYKGYHIITKVVSANIFVTATPYQGYVAVNSPTALMRLPEFSIYKGYVPGELVLPVWLAPPVDLHTWQPRTLVCTFKPEAGPDGLIEFDISGYLKTVIEQPYKCGYNDTEENRQPAFFFSLHFLPLNYNKVDILIKEPGNTIAGKECDLLVANASITTAELNRFYMDTGRPLTPLIKPAHFASGINHYDLLVPTTQVRIKL